MSSPRNVLVTGGASGIGAEVARLFVSCGDRVTVFDRSRPVDRVDHVLGDVIDPADNARAVERAAPDGLLHVLVANAGVHDGGLRLGGESGLEALAAQFNHVLEVNVLGYTLALHASAPALRRASGCALLTLSDAAFDVRGNGAGVSYIVSKHAGLGLLRAAARDLAPVRVNAVAPGGVPTLLSVDDPDGGTRTVIDDPAELARRVGARTLLGRGAAIAEVASAYFYLASEAAGAVTGQVLRVDGGLLP